LRFIDHIGITGQGLPLSHDFEKSFKAFGRQSDIQNHHRSDLIDDIGILVTSHFKI
jgi:hypothetical protein